MKGALKWNGCPSTGSVARPRFEGKMDKDWFRERGRPYGNVIAKAKGWKSSR